ncbi:MAG: ion transporter [Flavobacteriaceae bacterium]|nr:ion transporter [Flavobacteriaceae bacterium]MDA7727469.1 ion transporter [Flavobacteriaceae bacterium]MDA7849627.1 ion transporter [Flavobacteriaceae bacterium]MDG1310315.1 ion transporter [Flavobacteriaceae bacterium]
MNSKIKKQLWGILEDNTTKKGRYFDYFIQTLILLSLASFAIDTLPDLSIALRKSLHIFETISIIIFSVEYILRVYVSKHPFRYIFSFYGIIDLLSILPFYLSKFLDLRFLRAFRIFRVFRALKLIRYNKALNRFRLGFLIVREEIILFFLVTLVLIFITSAGIYFFENEAQPEVFKSVFHSAWWSIVTLTTVGYGDVYPITLGGKIFTFFVLMIGVGLVTVPAGLVATALSKARENEA